MLLLLLLLSPCVLAKGKKKDKNKDETGVGAGVVVNKCKDVLRGKEPKRNKAWKKCDKSNKRLQECMDKDHDFKTFLKHDGFESHVVCGFMQSPDLTHNILVEVMSNAQTAYVIDKYKNTEEYQRVLKETLDLYLNEVIRKRIVKGLRRLRYTHNEKMKNVKNSAQYRARNLVQTLLHNIDHFVEQGMWSNNSVVPGRNDSFNTQLPSTGSAMWNSASSNYQGTFTFSTPQMSHSWTPPSLSPWPTTDLKYPFPPDLFTVDNGGPEVLNLSGPLPPMHVINPVPTQLTIQAGECMVEGDSINYRGTWHETASGIDCQKWSDQSPHTHTYKPDKYPGRGLGDHNYCRDPQPEAGHVKPWCFVDGDTTRWDFCDVPLCETGVEAGPTEEQKEPVIAVSMWNKVQSGEHVIGDWNLEKKPIEIIFEKGFSWAGTAGVGNIKKVEEKVVEDALDEMGTELVMYRGSERSGSIKILWNLLEGYADFFITSECQGSGEEQGRASLRYAMGEWMTNVIIAKTAKQFIVYVNGDLSITEPFTYNDDPACDLLAGDVVTKIAIMDSEGAWYRSAWVEIVPDSLSETVKVGTAPIGMLLQIEAHGGPQLGALEIPIGEQHVPLSVSDPVVHADEPGDVLGMKEECPVTKLMSNDQNGVFYLGAENIHQLINTVDTAVTKMKIRMPTKWVLQVVFVFCSGYSDWSHSSKVTFNHLTVSARDNGTYWFSAEEMSIEDSGMSTSFDSDISGALPTLEEYSQKEADWLLSFEQDLCEVMKEVTPAPAVAPISEIDEIVEDDGVVIEDEEGNIEADNSLDIRQSLVNVSGSCIGHMNKYIQLKSDEKCSDYSEVPADQSLIRNITIVMFPVQAGRDCRSGGKVFSWSDQPVENPLLRYLPQQSLDDLKFVGDMLAEAVGDILG